MAERHLPSVSELQTVLLSQQSILDRGLRAGRVFSAGTGLQAVPKDRFFWAALVNPPGSGRLLRVCRLTAYCTGFVQLQLLCGLDLSKLGGEEVVPCNRRPASTEKPRARLRFGTSDRHPQSQDMGRSSFPVPAGTLQLIDLVGLLIDEGHGVALSGQVRWDAVGQAPNLKTLDTVVNFVWLSEDAVNGG